MQYVVVLWFVHNPVWCDPRLLANVRLCLQILSGHEGPVSGLAFSPVRAALASCSWDKTLRLWSVFEERGGSDVVQLSADGGSRGG